MAHKKESSTKPMSIYSTSTKVAIESGPTITRINGNTQKRERNRPAIQRITGVNQSLVFAILSECHVCVLFFTKILHTTIRNQFTPSPITIEV